MAADLGLVEDPQIWFDFLKDRNLMSYTYDEKEVAKVFMHLPAFVTETEKVIAAIEKSG